MAAAKIRPTAKPNANDKPVRNKYRAALSVAWEVRNKTKKRIGAGIAATRTASQGAVFRTRAIAVSLVEIFPIRGSVCRLISVVLGSLWQDTSSPDLGAATSSKCTKAICVGCLYNDPAFEN